MNNLSLAALSVAAFAVAVVILSPRFRCWSAGHDWNRGRPFTENGKRLEECRRCFLTRPHDGNRAEPAALHSQRTLDGTPAREGMRAVALTPEELASVRAKSAELQAEAQAAFEQATATESQRVN